MAKVAVAAVFVAAAAIFSNKLSITHSKGITIIVINHFIIIIIIIIISIIVIIKYHHYYYS